MIEVTWSRRAFVVASRGGLAALVVMFLVACSETTRAARTNSDWWRAAEPPDELPQMLNKTSPFRYPIAEFTKRVEGNVVLRLYVDTAGVVLPDSTKVSESSGSAGLDAAAVSGASHLRFRPARRRGTPIAVSMMFPVHFRHPDGVATPSRKDSAR